MFIYKITNNLNGKIYIGKTTGSVEKRFQRHCRLYSRCPKLAQAIIKYGPESFSIETIDTANSVDELNKKEIKWIDELNSIKKGYNLTHGGDGGSPTKETRDKISKANKGKKRTLELKRSFSEQRSGHLNGRSKKVCVTINGISKTYQCLKYAAQDLSINYSTARAVAQGVNPKTRSGITIRYLED